MQCPFDQVSLSCNALNFCYSKNMSLLRYINTIEFSDYVYFTYIYILKGISLVILCEQNPCMRRPKVYTVLYKQEGNRTN